MYYYPTYEPIPGKSHEVGTEAETLEMIRDVLAKELRASRRLRGPARGGRTIEVFDEYYRAKERDARDVLTQPATKAEAAFPEIEGGAPVRAPIEETEMEATKQRPRAARATSAEPKQKGYRLQRRHFVWTGLIALAFFRPYWVLATLAVFAFAIILLFWLAGPSRVWAGTLLALHRIGQRDPARSRRLRIALDRMAERWDRMLDLFPEGSVDSLYMPDFQALATAEDRHSQAMSARLSRMADQG